MFSFHLSEYDQQQDIGIIPDSAVPSSCHTSAGQKILENLVIGVDASVLMYQAVKHKSCGQNFSVAPPISVTEIIAYYWNRNVEAELRAG